MSERVTLFEAVDAVLKAFGAPGDWGYGTPKGDALMAVHRWRSEHAWQLPPRDSVAPAAATLPTPDCPLPTAGADDEGSGP